jgi:hypothetical protein
MTTLQPGTYILTRDVQNPSPDRRQRHDWRARETWEQGMKFSVFEIRQDKSLVIYRQGSSQPVYSHEPKFILLASSGAMKRIDEAPSDWLKRESANAGLEAIAILDAFVECEIITLDDVREMSKLVDAVDSVSDRFGKQTAARLKLRTLARIASCLEKYVLTHEELVEAQFGDELPTSSDSPVARAASALVDSRVGHGDEGSH